MIDKTYTFEDTPNYFKVKLKSSYNCDLAVGTCGVGSTSDTDKYGSTDIVFWRNTNCSLVLSDNELEHNPPTPGANQVYHHDYSENTDIGDYDSDHPISIQVPDSSAASYVRENLPNLDPWVITSDWCELYQGHFFWDITDQAMLKAYNGGTDSKKITLFCHYQPSWTYGHYEYDAVNHGGAGFGDQYDRPIDERLQSYFIRNLVNRYKVDGELWSQSTYGVEEIIYENEPGAPQTGYMFGYHEAYDTWHQIGFEPTVAIAMRMFYNYQIIKGIDEDIQVVSPNWCLNQPNMKVTNRTPSMDIAADGLNINGTSGSYTDLTFLDVLSYAPGMVSTGFSSQETEITNLYSDCVDFPDISFGGVTDNAKYGAMQKYTDIIDCQNGCVGAIGDETYLDSDPLFVEDVNSDFHFNYMGLNRYYEFYEIKQVEDWYQGDANKHVMSVENPYGPSPYTGSTLTGMYFMHYPDGEDYENVFRPYFSDFDTGANEDYRNIFWRRGTNLPFIDGVINASNDTSDPVVDNLMAGLITGLKAGPVLFEEGTYEDGAGPYTLAKFDETGSIYHDEDDTDGPTIVYFTFKYPRMLCIPDAPAGSYYTTKLLKMFRTAVGVSEVDVEIPVFTSTSSIEVNSISGLLYDSENFYTSVDDDVISSPGTEFTVSFDEGTISKETVIFDPMTDYGAGDEEQGVFLTCTGGGWNLVSFNVEPTGVTWSTTEPNAFLCNTLFTGSAWDMLGQIENSYGLLFDYETQSPTGYTWNMEQGYNVQVNENKLYGISSNEQFIPDIGIQLPWDPGSGTGSWPYVNNKHRFFVGYYPDYYANVDYAFADIADNNNFVCVKDDDERYSYYIQASGEWRGALETVQPGRGYTLEFSNGSVLEETNLGEVYPYLEYEEDPQTSAALPGGGKDLRDENSIASALFHFTYTTHTPDFHPIVIDTILIEGIEVEPGDQVAVFTPADLCVGAKAYEGEFPIYLAAWMDDYTTEEIDGYTYGESMIFRFWDASEGVEIVFEPGATIQTADDPVFPTHSGFGMGNVAFRTLSAGNPANILPQSFILGQNYPNPFNPTTTIPFALPTESQIKLEIFNLLGQRVAVVEEGIFQAGNHKTVWDGRNSSGIMAASGVYLLKMHAEGTVKAKSFDHVSKLILMK